MSNPRRKKKSTKALLCEEDLAAIRTSYRRSWTPILYTSADEDHKVKERYVRINDRRSRRRAKHAHMRRGEHASAGFEHCFKKRGQVGDAKESYDRLPPQAHSEILQEACETYKVDFDAQFPLSPSIHTSSGSSEAPSSEGFEEAFFREIENQDRKGIQTWLCYRYDHPHACGHRPRRLPTKPFDFMGLPVETRCEILRLLLERNKELTDVSPNADFESYAKVPVDTRLFAVSRQIEADAQLVFFSSNQFRVHVTHSHLSFYMRSPSSTVRAMKKVHLSISHTSGPRTLPNLAVNLDRAADTLNECTKLVQLKISQSWNDEDSDGYSKEIIEESLEYFTRIRGVGEVVFTNSESRPGDEGLVVASEAIVTRLTAILQSPKTG